MGDNIKTTVCSTKNYNQEMVLRGFIGTKKHHTHTTILGGIRIAGGYSLLEEKVEIVHYKYALIPKMHMNY